MKSLPNRRLVATARSLFAAKNRLLDACTFCIGVYDLKPKEKKDEEATVKLISKLINQLLPKEAVVRLVWPPHPCLQRKTQRVTI